MRANLPTDAFTNATANHFNCKKYFDPHLALLGSVDILNSSMG